MSFIYKIISIFQSKSADFEALNPEIKELMEFRMELLSLEFHIKLHCYCCSLITEALHLNEHEAAKWLTKEELDSVNWLPADLEVIEALKDMDSTKH